MTARARPLPQAFPTLPRESAPLARPDAMPVPVPGAPRLRWWALLTVTVLAAFFSLIMSRIALDRSAFELADIAVQLDFEESRYWQLRLEAVRLQSPDRILAVADELGMVYPDAVKPLEVAGIGEAGPDADDRWVDLKVLFGAGR